MPRRSHVALGDFHVFLPSATKLRRLCFYNCLSFCHSVHAGIPHPPPGPGTPRPGPGTHRDQTPPGTRHPSPCQQTATVADGTHPTGMHSCLFIFIPTKGQERVCERQVVFLHAREKISRTNSITIILFRNVFLKTCFC